MVPPATAVVVGPACQWARSKIMQQLNNVEEQVHIVNEAALLQRPEALDPQLSRDQRAGHVAMWVVNAVLPKAPIFR